MYKDMLKRMICIVLSLNIFLVSDICVQAKTESKDLNIYAMYLGTNEKGESVLLESDGEYLLMDLGKYECVDAVIKQLKALKVKKISLYFSHLHGDHTGSKESDVLAGMKKLNKAGIKITTLYMPARTVVPKSGEYPKKAKKFKNYMKGKGKVKLLTVGNSFSIGDAKVKIIGPVGMERFSVEDFKDKKDTVVGAGEDIATVYYENDCSLVARVTCGKTKYLACGDIMEEETDLLVKKYGNKLASDIMKVPHHGTGSGINNKFMKAVSPQYAFAQNTGYTGIDKKTKKRITYITQERLTKYAMLYLTGNEKATLVYNIKNDNIRIYKKSIKMANLLTGWQKLVGGDGVNRKFDKYYFDKNGKLQTGVKKIDGKYFYLAKSGCMQYGSFDKKGKYSGWKSGSDGRRYFTFTKDGEFSIMTTGFKTIGGKRYYFKYSTGYKITSGSAERKLITLGKNQYGVGSTGVFITNTWSTIGGKKYYFDEQSRMVKQKIVKINGKYYYFGKDGTMLRGKQLLKLDDKVYGVGEGGGFMVNTFTSIGKDKYYFDDTGLMIRNKKKKIGKIYRYFGKDGKMQKDLLVEIDGKKYYFNIYGSMVQDCYVRINGVKYYCDKNGVVSVAN